MTNQPNNQADDPDPEDTDATPSESLANPTPPDADPATAEHVRDTSGTVPQRRSDAED